MRMLSDMLSLLCNGVLPSADQNRDSMQPSVLFSDIKVGGCCVTFYCHYVMTFYHQLIKTGIAKPSALFY